MTNIATIQTDSGTLYRLRQHTHSTSRSSVTGQKDLVVDRLGSDGWASVERHREDLTSDAIVKGLELIDRMYFEKLTAITFYPDVEGHSLTRALEDAPVNLDECDVTYPNTDQNETAETPDENDTTVEADVSPAA